MACSGGSGRVLWGYWLYVGVVVVVYCGGSGCLCSGGVIQYYFHRLTCRVGVLCSHLLVFAQRVFLLVLLLRAAIYAVVLLGNCTDRFSYVLPSRRVSIGYIPPSRPLPQYSMSPIVRNNPRNLALGYQIFKKPLSLGSRRTQRKYISFTGCRANIKEIPPLCPSVIPACTINTATLLTTWCTVRTVQHDTILADVHRAVFVVGRWSTRMGRMSTIL